MTILKFDSLESTNRYCEALDLSQVGDFTCYWALSQTAGIGQRGNHWASAPGENLTFSLVLKPGFLSAARQFRLTQALSLALVDFIGTIGSPLANGTPLRPTIKWPNDIYVGHNKICGTLVSNRLQGDTLAASICGVGFNVNQRQFPSWVPNPTSLALLTGRTYALDPLLHRLLDCIGRRYDALRAGEDPTDDYLAHLLNLGVPARYAYHGEELTATITGVDPFGHLLLTADDGRRLRCAMKEIKLCM